MTDDERIMAVEAFLGDRKYWEHSVRMFIDAAEKESDKIIKEYLFAVYGSGHDSSDMEIIKSLPDDFKKSREESKWCPSGNRHFWSKSGFIITAHEYIFIIHQNNAGLYDSIMR